MNYNINTRTANVEDQSWIITQINKQENTCQIEEFNPNDFLVLFNEQTEEKIGFGRIEYVRDTAQKNEQEHIEINSIVITNKQRYESQEISHYISTLVVELLDQIRNEEKQVYTYVDEHTQSTYENLQFKTIEKQNTPTIIQQRYDNKFRSSTNTIMHSQINSVVYDQKETQKQNQNNKSKNTEIEKLEEEFTEKINEENTKYSI